MFQLSLRSKTIIGTAAIEGALLLLLIVVATRFFSDTLNSTLQKRADTTATLFATMTKDAVLSYDLASLDAFLNEVLRNPDIEYARVLDADGNVFAEMGKQVLLSRDFQADSHLSEVSDGIFDSYALIKEGESVYGRVEIGISIDLLQQALSKITNWTLSIALTEMLLVGLFSWFLGSYLTSQLQTLKRATNRIQKAIKTGDFTRAKLDTKGQDEIAQVAQAFNLLVSNLEAQNLQTKLYQDELQAFNNKLEEIVEQRTEQLASKNAQLQSTFDELKLAQQQLIQTEKMASMGQLAAGLAHEINNPIGFIKSNVSSLNQYNKQFVALYELCAKLIICQDVDAKNALIADLKSLVKTENLAFVSQDASDLIRDVREGVNRVIEIVQNMTVFSRVDSDKKQLFDINRCVETTVKMAKKQIEAKGQIQLVLGKLPQTCVNVGKINQVLTNLLVNASQAISENGKVIIKTSSTEKRVKITVADTGVGIPQEYIDKIFDPFFTTKAEGEGTGLGLSISFDIIKEHGGQLSVSSKPGKGTVFTILLPVQFCPIGPEEEFA
uniref:sensor histidine kinase n=1 Tax=Ningiella ruwaisensis TaxID=2364274 RepID=UPI0010A031B5|nr:ATP-binding protein [Ningiella ruwaisensis]